MDFDIDFVNGILNNADISAEEKVTQLINGYNTATNGLISKRDELLGTIAKHKADSDAWTKSKAEYDLKIANLEETLKKASTDKEASADYWKNQYEGKLKEKDDLIAQSEEKFNGLQSKYFGYLKKEAIRNATKDLVFMDGLQNGFINTVLMNNEFEPKDINGEIKFLNKDNKELEAVVHDFSLTKEGKAYLKSLSSGSGAKPNPTPTGVTVPNGKQLTRTQFQELQKDPVAFAEFRKANRNWSIIPD